MANPQTTTSTEAPGCLAEEWHRDGRGLWAMRSCRLGTKHGGRHDFWAWQYSVKPPASARAEQAEAREQELTQRMASEAPWAELQALREALTDVAGTSIPIAALKELREELNADQDTEENTSQGDARNDVREYIIDRLDSLIGITTAAGRERQG